MIPDRKLENIRKDLGELSQKGIERLIDYLNHDKYLAVQAMAKAMNEENVLQIVSFLDGCISRNDGMIVTLTQCLKKDTGAIQIDKPIDIRKNK